MKTGSHDWMVPRAESGCLVLADISGYTRYLQATELEHAQDVLSDLTETVVGRLRPTLRISKLEGDAVFAYGLDEELESSILLDAIDDAYFAFRSRRRDVSHATSCDCQACVRIPQLNLKFVAHHGRFVRKPTGGGQELTGSDVVLTHRLLKNQVSERLGIGAYSLLTEACVEALGIDPASLGMEEYRESYEEIGEVTGYVENLEERWTYEQERRRVFVVPAEAEFEVVHELPAPPPVVWEFISSPTRRPLWQSKVDRVDQTNPGGRQGVGTTNHCAHGRGTFVQEILDWRPYRYFTNRTRFPFGWWTWTFEFQPRGGDWTEIRIRGEALRGWRKLSWLLIRRRFFSDFEADVRLLDRALREHQERSAATPA